MPFGGCMTVSVVEHAHSKAAKSNSTVSTTASDDNAELINENELLSDQWEPPVERRRASSVEAWLNKTLRREESEEEVDDKLARRAVRRAKRKAFFRKLFGRSVDGPVVEIDHPTPRRSLAVDLSVKATEEEGENGSYRLNDLYYSAMSNVLDQYKVDTDDETASTTDKSEISVIEFEEEEDVGKDELMPIPESDVSSPVHEEPVAAVPAAIEYTYYAPPVTVPIEYTLQDRRGGVVVAGRHVLFTSAAFKRKQRALLYTMRSVPEDEQLLIESMDSDSDDELVTDGVFQLDSEWI